MGTIWPDSLPQSKGAKYTLVADVIRKAIDTKELEVGVKLPPVRELAYKLGITPGTVARAYTILTDEGLLNAEVGRGTFVAPPKRPVLDDVWSRQLYLLDERDDDNVSLFSPRLADMGQVALIRECLQKVAQGDPAMFLNYPTRDAYAGVRQAVVDWMSDLSLGPLTADDIVLTHGGQSGLCVVFQTVFKGPKPVVLVEDLSYAGFRRAAELMRADVIGVRMDKWGIDPMSLDLTARQSPAQAICVSPEVQNPTGSRSPLERRKEVVEVARKHDLQIIEDDCYRMGEPQAPSYRALAPERGWHVSSVSKTLTPALRVGFAIAPEGQSAGLRRSAEYGYFGLAQPLAELTRLMLSDPRARDLARAVQRRMAEYVRVTVNTLGGFDLVWDSAVPFVWLRLPSGWRSAAFTRAAERAGVQVRSADEFALRDGRAPNAVRIAMNAHVSLERFETAMVRLRALLDNPPEQISV
ncbi:PLP-dependent aminotransferase family protein [Ruegeria pomeroyi]|uniref:Transcriptional regulator, GntR family n=2 Tax=Ruegeria pomeroyi TaxID=89184 RepID=Q5LSS6_RUEPO|nr:PLP-dependent aminotransferase family protein [Ruegeria pomeroyi]HCE72455.1 PLP-dependent aminotransferase family protein [Ruegeria sp.]AAV94975.1 transcriptional regulator, GntR family [Ruegeria pomeroyi DSS-3]NVK97699.1 PLP-dependent aminotransferase family protein [Ruegeria pomeroyi]NVL02668.1 PLP-dependent aminotransferase family protein [Ruegeria pomeroyi]QWV08543.1 PLP-dependent aminotransferase family protein [Ruegeria pomeroyi]